MAVIAISAVLSCKRAPAEIHVSSISFTESKVELTVGDQLPLEVRISPDNATNKEITWASDNEAVATVSAEGVVQALKAGTANITATSEDSGVNATCEITVTEKAISVTSSVDLGLSVKWASCNLGASKPTEYGGYYQWAGTEDVSDTSIYLDWSNCPCHTGSSYSSGWKKYNTNPSYGTVDNKTILEPIDDAAAVALGGKWRMPTDEEWSELCNIENCSWTWTSIDSVNGYKVQSKMSGYTDKWIFLPAAGYRNYGNLDDVGSCGGYWSSSLAVSPSYAYYMDFKSGNFERYGFGRYLGRSVRPVSE